MVNKKKLFDVNNPVLRHLDSRKYTFKEVASNIVHHDRFSRKNGLSVDTGGSIARAMENAYKLGLSHGNSQETVVPNPIPDNPDMPISWNAIPSRSRDLFDGIIRYKWLVVFKKNADPFASNSDKWECYWYWERKPPAEQYQLLRAYSISTVSRLTNLGLLVERNLNGTRTLFPTMKGLQTWEAREYTLRSESEPDHSYPFIGELFDLPSIDDGR